MTAEAVVAKGEFARIIKVSAGRVSQYLAEGKISPAALVGEGRLAKIRVERAKADLRRNLDVGQRLGNGIDTRLDSHGHVEAPQPIAAPLRAPAAAPVDPAAGTIEDSIKREKLRAAQFANRKAAEEEEARRGRFIETAAAEAQMTQVAAAMLQAFEGSLADFATAVSAKFQIPQRDVLHLLRTEFRAVRARAEEQQRRRGAALPETVEVAIEVEDDDA